jgi:hypothetical protein
MLLFATPVFSAERDAAVEWNVLRATRQVETHDLRVLEFPQPVRQLDKKTVAIKGFRVPLETKTHFLVAFEPTDCPDCVEGGPSHYVEVFSREPVAPTFGRPITVSGLFVLLGKEPGGAYYRLMDATVVSAD